MKAPVIELHSAIVKDRIILKERVCSRKRRIRSIQRMTTPIISKLAAICKQEMNSQAKVKALILSLLRTNRSL